uniref:Uncharacterized protein n=1 Tax=Timema douglasi TaxID=61478 RepID=A0A7R8VQ49_TIMDO|nr:unnamed protein product [Timema douglasi]
MHPSHALESKGDSNTVDMTAYQSLAVVFSQRCLESGITEVYCNMEAKPGSKSCYAMTIDTAQGQTLKVADVYLRDNSVVCSRDSSSSDL